MKKKAALLLLIGIALARPAPAQPTGQQPAPQPFQAYLGTYEYQKQYGGSLQLLPKDSLLLALIDGAEYPLRYLKPNVFRNGSGDTIPFRRDGAGVVTGFSEHGIFYKRTSATTATPPTSVFARLAADGRRPRYEYAAPRPVPADGLAVGSLADAGIHADAHLAPMVQAIIDETYPGVNSVLIWHHGKLVLEEYFYGRTRQDLQQLRSASKSFVSALVGAAIDRKLLPDEQTRVLPHLPYPALQHPDPRKSAWTVQDFLTMRTGLDCNDNDGGASAGNETNMYGQPDWVKFVLDLPLTSAPGATGSYCSGAVAVLGRTVERVAKQPLPAFAETALFRPLGITNYQWNYRLDSTNPTVAQLYMAPRDFLKFGILYAQRGQWAGRQVLSAGWVARSLGKYSKLGSKQYGYFWWHQRFEVGGQVVEAQMATGNGGQKLYLLPTLDAVVVFTGSNYNSARDTPPNELMPKYVLPALLTGRK